MAHGATLFRMLNIIVGMLLVLGGILLFVRNNSWNSSILGVYICAFGLLTFFLEFQIPEIVVYNVGFMFTMLGRGIFYLSMGCLCLAWKWFNIVVGCVIMAVGVFYIGMHFLGATPSPSMSAVPAPTYNNVDRNYPHDENYIHPEDDEYEQKAPQSYQSPVVGTSYGARE